MGVPGDLVSDRLWVCSCAAATACGMYQRAGVTAPVAMHVRINVLSV